MPLFLSTFTNKVDRKGRVSVPAAFRSVLAEQRFPGIIASRSLVNSSVRASGIDYVEKLHESIDELDPLSVERDILALTLLADTHQLAFDADGRVTLNESLIEHARIGEAATFVGKGLIFEIWEPEAFRRELEEARARAVGERIIDRVRAPHASQGGAA
jgi:MraZ protein